MKILDKYISKSYIKLSIVTILLTSAMMSIVEVFISFQTYMGMPMKNILYLMALHYPSTINFVVGPSLLFATTYFISSLYSNNEFISFLSAGIAYKRIIFPILIIGTIYTGLLFAFNEKVKIPCDIKYDNKKYEFLKVDKSYKKDNRNVSIQDKNNNITIRATRYRDAEKKLENLDLAVFNENNELKEKITAAEALWQENDKIWVLKNAKIHFFDIENDKHEYDFKDSFILENFNIEPRYFRAEGEDIRTLSISESKAYLDNVKNISSSMYFEKLTDFYKRVFTPFTAFLMIIISLSINLKNKKNALMFSIICSLAIGVVYYVLDMAFTLMAKQGLVKPFIAISLPLLIIVILAVVGTSRVSS